MKGIKWLCVLMVGLSLFSCAKEEQKNEPEPQAVAYKDGVYTARSSIQDKWGGTGGVTITIKDGAITECEFLTYQKDGSVKDEDYGKVDGKIQNAGFYKIAQNALKQNDVYANSLVEMQDIEEVDAITGATISHELFQDAVRLALKQAEKTTE